MAAILGLPDLAHAAPPGRVFLFAFVDGQTRIDLQWSRNSNASPPVQDHKIEACQETDDNDCHDADDTDWTTLVAEHPQEASTRHSNKYTHTGLSEGETWHYRVWSRNTDLEYVSAENRGEATATTESMPMHMDESDNPTCEGARWKAYVTVSTFGAYDYQGYRNYGDGALDNQSFMLGGVNYTVTQLYYDHERTNYPSTNGRWYFPASYHFAVTEYPFDPGKLEDLTLYVGDVRLPLSTVGAHSTQGFGEAYRWGWSNRRWTDGMQQSPYDDTFDYRDGDRVMVCLTDTAPTVTLVLTPDSISESGSSNSTTVTATLEEAVDTAFTVTVSADAVSPAVAGDFELSANKVLTFAANAIQSTGTVTITARDNNVDAPDKTVTVSGELSSGAHPYPPAPVELTIEDDEPEPTLSLAVDPAAIAEAEGTSTIKVSASGSTFAEDQTIALTLGGEATEADDYTVSSKSLTLGAGQTEVTATVTAVDDSIIEDDETIVVTATHGANQVGTAQTITINDDDLPELSIADATAVVEGEAAQFVVTLAPASSKQVTVTYSTTDGTAKASEDYTAASSTTLTFAANETTKTISVPTTEDTRNEDQETFTVTLSGETNATLKADAKTATGTINDDDDLPVLSIAGATVNEGEAASFVVTLAPASGKQVTVSYSTADGTAEASEDYTAASSTTLTFAAGDTTKTISVATTEDTRNEDQETFTVALSGPTNATLKADAKTATGTINDDDALPVLSIAHATPVAEGEAAQFAVTLTPASGKQVTVSYSTADGTAKASEDYTAASSTTLTFAAGDTTKTISVATTEDTRNEDQETFTVALSGPANATLKADAKTATGTINDDDTLPVLSIAGATVNEGEAAQFAVTLTPASGKQVTVNYSTADGTAKASEDYTAASSTTLTFAAGDTTKTISVPTTEDTRNEDQETFTVALSGPANATLKADAKTATGTINDDDTLPVLSIAGATVNEGEAASFVVTLAPASGKQVTVSYSTADGTAKASEDYTAASSTTLTFAAGDTTKTVSVPTTEDTRNEDQETFTVALSGPANATLKADAKTATGTINDDDDLPVLSIAGATVNEGEAASFVVTLAPASGKQVTVSYSTADGSAKASEDYTAASSTTLTFAAGDTTKTISVPTTEDTRNEDQETFTVALSGPTNATLKADARTATGTINDDDDPPVLSIADATAVAEGEAASFVVTLTPASGKQVTVTYSTTDGTAKASEDYTAASSTTLTFAANETTKTISVPTTEDTRNEDQETFTVTLNGPMNATLKADAKTATGTINDDDDLPVLSIAGATVNEGEAASFVVTLAPASGKQVTVSYSTADGTAKASEDYTAASSTTLTFAAGDTTKTISVPTTEDTRNEDQETFTVALSGPTNATLKADAKTATGTINDDDALPQLSIAGATVDEGATAQFEVTLTPASGKQVTVNYSTADGTAKASEDYTAASSTTLTFAAGDTTKTISVPTTEDTRNEDQETFTVALSGPTNATLKADAKTATGTINDDDALPVLSIADATVDEGDTAQFVVTLTPASGRQVTVSYSTTDGTAKAAEDYTAASGTTLTFAAGDTTKTISVPTTEDTRNEDQETFTVALSGPANATLKADATTATATINDDDALPVLSIAHATPVAEGEAAQFAVTLTPASGKQVTVSYSTADGTAKASEDYTAASSTTLTFAAGDTTKTISVPTTEDTRNEDQETFTVALSGPANATLKADAKTATGTINDDDALPVLSIAHATPVAEGEAAQFAVTLTPASGKQVTVNYSTADGSAKASEDYTAASSTTLTFAAGETTKTISVPTTEDTRNEDQETFTVALSGPASATLKADAKTATGTINDDDALPVLSIAGATVDEGDTAQFVVTLAPASGKQVTVSYSTADGTAKASENDYTAASSTTLTFAAGDTTKTISVPTTEDTRDEDQETFTVTLSGPTNATLKSDAKTATGTINDDDDLPVLSIAGATVDEGDTAQFVVTLAPASGKQVTVNYSTADGTAKAPEDYTAASSTTLTFAAGDTTKTISVATTEDTRNEDQEAFTVTLSGSTNATLKSDAKTATGTINDDDDDLPVLSIAHATPVDEGEASSFVVTLAPASGRQVTVSYSTTDGTAKASEDYTAASSTTLTFAAGDTTKTISVPTTEDTRNEDQETFTVALSGPTNATLKSDAKTATGTINDDDALPVLSIAHATPVSEGAAAQFEVTLAPASGKQVTVKYSTADGTAKASEDYTAASSTTLTFAAGDTTKTISVPTTEDTHNEDQEAFTVTLSEPANATLKADAKTATGTINDDDDLPVLSIAHATPVAEGEAAQFAVTLTPASGKQVTVSYSTADGTAKAAEDYTAASSTTLTFVAGDTTKTISVPTTEDSRNEDQEAFTVTLSEPANATLKSDAKTATGTINDDDPLTAAVTAKAQNVTEGESAEFEVKITGGTSTADVVVLYSIGGTATSSDDYDDPGGSLTITSGAASGTITIATKTDDVVEPSETLQVTLTSASTASRTVTVGGTAATTTILEKDSVTVSVKAVIVEDVESTEDVNEYRDKSIAAEGASAEFAVELSGAVSSAVQVSYATENGTAESGTGKDYTAKTGTLTFNPNEPRTQTITVDTNDDTLNEATETFTVKLTAPNLPAGVALGTATATGSITDLDALEASVTANAASVDEGKTATFTVSLTGGTSTAPVVVRYSLGGSATSGDDYTAPDPTTLTIAAGTSSGTFTIVTLTDNVVPETESLEITLDSATSAGTVTVSTAAATTAINNTTRPTLILEDDPSSSVRARRSASGAPTRSRSSIACDVCMTEGDTTTGTTKKVRPMLVAPGTHQKVIIPDGQTVTIGYETSDGTGQSGQDYVRKQGTLTFTGDPNDGFKAKLQTPITLQTIGDTLNEPDRTFTLTLLSATLPDSTTTDPVSFTVAVRDDDPIGAAVKALSSRVSEGQSATFQVNLSGGTPTADVVIQYTVGGSATSGADYTAPPGTLTIASDHTSGTITIETLADGVREPNDETMVVTLTGATTAGTATVASGGATATISGEEPPAQVQPPAQVEPVTARVSVSAGAPSVNEGDTATFEVTVSGGSNTEVRISYSVGGTATPGADYTAPSGTLTIGSGASSGTIAIETLADDVLEPDETLVVKLDGASAGSGVTVTLDVTQATTTIVDGAGGTSSSGVTVSVAPATATEGDDASFAVELSGKVSVPVTVNWSAASGPDDTASVGTDYTAAGGTLTFSPMETSGTVQVTTLDDEIKEAAETFTVTLAGPDLPAGVTLGTARATGTIVDDDSLFVTVTAGSATVAEGNSAVFAVALSGGTSAADVLVEYAVGGTATAGDDYVEPAGTLTIAGGASGASLVIETLADDVLDPGETLEVTLTGAATANGAVSVSATSATMTITDAGAVTVSVAPATVTEGDDASFAVELSGKVAAPVTVGWSAASGPGDTAEAGADYTAVDGTLTFAPAETGKAVRVSTLRDGVEEAAETFTVTLTGPDLPAGVTLRTDRATGTIVDVTPPTATLTSADEFPAAGTFSVTITFSEAVTGFAPEDIQVTNGTAANLAGTDPVYSVDVTPNQDFAGDVTVAIPADAVIDAQGLGNIAASADFAADTTSPVVEVEVAWGAAAYTATEGGAAAQVTVSLSDDPQRTVVIPLTARNGNGATDADYSGVPAQVTFAGGRTAHTFAVTAISDVDDDAGETVTLGFGALPAAVSAGNPASATITLAGESAQTRHARVIRTLLPEAAVAMTDATVGTIGDRLDDVVRRSGTRGSLALAGVEMLTPLSAHEGSPESVYWTSRDQVRNISGAQLIRGSSFVMTLADRARMAGAASPEENPGSAAVWGSGDYRKLGGSEDALAWRGDMVSLHLGADLVALPNLVAGLALSRSVVGFDYTDRTNPRTVTGTFETDLLGVHPYASWTPSAALGFWATGGLGWGGVGIDDSLDELQTSTTRLLSGALGGSSRVLSVNGLVPGGATALYVKGEGFLTGAWAEESGRIVAQDVGVQQIRLSVEGSHEQRGLWGSVLTPALELGLRHDSGDAAQGAGVELGGELRYVQPELGLTIEGRGRVLATHRSTTEEWGLGGRIQLEFGSDRQGLSLSLAPSLGVVASGTHALWEYGVADGNGLGRPGAGEAGASSRLDAQADYRLLAMGGLGMLTPYGGLSLERDGRDYRAGARLETDTFNLSLEGKRSERGTGAVDHGVTVQGAVRF